MNIEQIRNKLKNLTYFAERSIKKLLTQEEFDFFKSEIERQNLSFAEAGHLIVEDKPLELPKCKICGKPVTSHHRQGREWSTYCSAECRKADKDTIMENRRQNCLNKYGVESIAQVDAFQQKRKATMKAKYGTEQVFKSNYFKQKRHETVKEKYGVDFVTQSDEFKNKRVTTMLNKYGSAAPMNIPEIKQKIEQTNLEKYGTTAPILNSEVQKKRQNTLKEKYGEDYKNKIIAPAQNKILKERGVKSLFNDPEFQQMSAKIRLDAGYQHLLDRTVNDPNSKILPLFTRNDYIGYRNIDGYKWKCKECGREFIAPYRNILPVCRVCHPYSISSGQQEVVDYIKTLYNGPMEINTRKIISPLELDIYLPELHLAIEYNGTYWHSEQAGKDKSYHINKSFLCEQQDIHLIHIFEYQWTLNKRQIKQRLSNILGSYTNKVFARKCIVREIDFDITSDFLNSYHLQGSCSSKVNLGLFYNNELVSVMTFGKPRFNKDYQWELIRFCNKEGYHVIGAASKLLKYFERNYNPKSLISYANRCWSWGKHNVYKDILGMTYIGKSDANYVYINEEGTILPRYKAQKHKLKKLLGEENFIEELTETENMEINGWIKSYDCGNLVFGKRYN